MIDADVHSAAIAAALADTVTTHGGNYYEEYFRCPRAFQLQHEELVTLRTSREDNVYFGVGKLVHAGLRFAQEALLDSRDPAQWSDVLAHAVASGAYEADIALEAERLLTHYFCTYDVNNAGWPVGTQLHAVEQLLTYDVGGLPVTAQADSVLTLGDELLIADHKTRRAKLPDGYERVAKTRPQFLRLVSLYTLLHPNADVPSVWVNALVKTKIPSFERVVVRFTREDVARWVENQERLAYALQRLRGPSDPRVFVSNFGACAPEYGSACQYRDYCWGTPEQRERLYTVGAPHAT